MSALSDGWHECAAGYAEDGTCVVARHADLSFQAVAGPADAAIVARRRMVEQVVSIYMHGRSFGDLPKVVTWQLVQRRGFDVSVIDLSRQAHQLLLPEPIERVAEAMLREVRRFDLKGARS